MILCALFFLKITFFILTYFEKSVHNTCFLFKVEKVGDNVYHLNVRKETHMFQNNPFRLAPLFKISFKSTYRITSGSPLITEGYVRLLLVFMRRELNRGAEFNTSQLLLIFFVVAVRLMNKNEQSATRNLQIYTPV
jgi:hypothetical protein